MKVAPIDLNKFEKVYPTLIGEAKSIKSEELYAQMLQYMQCGPSFQLTVGDDVIAYFGVLVTSPGIGQMWGVVSDKIHANKVSLTKWLQRNIPKLKYAENQKFFRIQTMVDARRGNWVRWLKICGLNQEGIMRHGLGRNKNAVLLAYVK